MVRIFRPRRSAGRRPGCAGRAGFAGQPALAGRSGTAVGLERLERRDLLAVDVTNLLDSGAGSLRAAIEKVNSGGVADSIVFRDLSAGTIHAASTLPTLAVSGTTFQFAGTTTAITLDGSGAGPAGDGLIIGAGVNSIGLSGIVLTVQYFATNGLSFAGGSTGTSINGLSLRSNGLNGIQFAGGDYSGTTVRNTQIIDNGLAGIVSAGPVTGLTIGGTLANQSNTISVNGTNGIELAAGSSTGTSIVGNRIIDNLQSGIATAGGVAGLTIGGVTAAAANTIALNEASGIQFGPGDYSGTVVQGNTISFNNAAGINLAVGGGSATGLMIGGGAAGAGNEISGNGTAGILASAGTYTGTSIVGNSIRTNATHGVSLAPAGSGITGLTVGGVNSAMNKITANSGDGVNVQAGTFTGTVVQANEISLNSGAGVRLAAGGGSLAGLAVGGSKQATLGNVLIGNQAGGVVAEAGIHTGTLVQGNQIGGSAVGISLNGAQQIMVGGATADLGNTVAAATQQGLFATGTLTQATALSNTFTTNAVGAQLQDATGFAFGAPGAGNRVTGGTSGIVARGVLDNSKVQGNTVTGAVSGIVLANARASAPAALFNVGGTTTAAGNGAGNNVTAASFGLFATGALGNTFVAGNILRATAFGGNGAALINGTGLMLGGSTAGEGNILTAALGNGFYAKGLCTNSQVFRNTMTASQYGIVLDSAQNLFVGFLYNPSLGNLVQYNQIGLFTTGNNAGTGVTYTNFFRNVRRQINAGRVFIFPA